MALDNGCTARHRTRPLWNTPGPYRGGLYRDYLAAKNFGVGGGQFCHREARSSNCLMHTLTCKSPLYSASGRRRRSAAPGLRRRGAPSSHPGSTRAGPNKAMGVWTPPTLPRLPWAGRWAGPRTCPLALTDTRKFCQGKASPPSLKTKISHKIVPPRTTPPPAACSDRAIHREA